MYNRMADNMRVFQWNEVDQYRFCHEPCSFDKSPLIQGVTFLTSHLAHVNVLNVRGMKIVIKFAGQIFPGKS